MFFYFVLMYAHSHEVPCKGVQMVHSDGQAVVKPCHPQQGESKDIAIQNLNTFTVRLPFTIDTRI